MDINATLFGQIMFIWVPVCTWFIYTLAKRKTESPRLVTWIGFFLSFLPPFALLLIVILAVKDSVKSSEATS